MKMMKKQIHTIVTVLVLLCIAAGIVPAANAAAFGPRYDGQAAVDYAAAHWNDGIGVCDEFVKTCLGAGGVEILAGGVDPLKNALIDTKLASAQDLVISADGVHALASENPNVRPGDVLFFYCKKCSRSIHAAIIGGQSAKGYLYAYAHNPGWDKVDWFGNFTHTLPSGERHNGCFVYTVAAMDRENYSHPHNFTGELYEEAHPHQMYTQCSCNARYYLGWNATVSYCTICNPPEKTKPVVTAVAEADAIVLHWTTVENALEYQVWRAKKPEGPFFNIYNAMGTKLTNRSVEKGIDYYYKVVAVLEKDGAGNCVNSAESDLVHCKLETAPAQPGTPVITGILNAANKAVISWSAVTGSAKYEVWRSTSENGTYSRLITTTKLNCTNTPVPGTYYYKVRAIASNGTAGAYSNVVCITVPGAAAENKPVITGTLNGANKAVISWNALSGAARYEVWRSTSENGTYSRLITTTKLTCTNTPVPGTYYYKVRAIASNGTAGSYSNVVCLTVPGAETDKLTVTGVLNASNKAVISWNALSGAAKYEVWRSTSETGSYIRLITTAKCTCTNTPAPGTYYYKVRAVASNGTVGSYSNIVCVTVE